MKLDIHEWIQHVEEVRPAVNALVMRLQQENVTVELNQSLRRLVGAIPFVATFFFEHGVETKIWFQMKEYQTNSDVVITNMGTNPEVARRSGFGSQAVRILLLWAQENNLHVIRATQVSSIENQKFWEKNGFVRCPEPNITSDYVYSW